MSGEGEEAIRQIKTAMRLEPHYPWSYPADLGTAYLISRKHADAVTMLNEATRRNSESEFYLAMLAISYAYSGKKSLAEEAVSRWREVTLSHGAPNREAEVVTEVWYFKNEADRKFMQHGFIMAGAMDIRREQGFRQK